MRTARFMFAALFAVALGGNLFALELTSGRMRVELFENTGRFSAYYKSDSGQWTPLFYSPDPRTTVLEILAGNNLYRMGDSQRFKEAVTKTASGGQISWTSEQFSVTESFAFATSSGASAADGVRVTIRITNLSANAVSFGARYLIDTYLGEQSRIEFMTPSEGSMTNETQFAGSQVPAYWVSPKNEKKSIALEAVMRGAGVTTPDRVVFANWKRLNDSRWNYTSDPTHNFNLLPYSINDSAVAMYYDAQQLQPNASRTITMLLGQFSSGGWGASAPATSAAQPPATAQAKPAVTQLLDQANTAQQSSTPQGSASPPDPRATVESDLSTVDSVLTQIDKMLSSPGDVTQSDIDVLRQVLDKLNARKTQSGQQ